MPRAPYRMSKSGRLLLADIHHRPGVVQHGFDNIQRLVLALCGEGGFQLEGVVEMIFDGGLVAACYENEFLDAGLGGFLHSVLDQRFIDDGQHFLGHGLGGRQEAGA